MSSDARDSPPLRFWWIVLFALVLLVLLAFRVPLEGSRQGAALVACLVGTASVLVILRLNPARPLLLGSIYAALLTVFHVGLLLPISLGAPVSLFNPADLKWVESPGFVSAAVLAAIAITAFTLGYLLRYRFIDKPPEAPPPTAAKGNDGAGIVGATLLLAGVLLWLFIVLRSGVPIIGSSYAGFLEATSGTQLPTAYLLMGFGMGAVAASDRQGVRRVALVAFGLWAVPAFLLGLRGEVIIPAACYIVVAARRREIRLRAWMAFAGVAALAAGSAVRVLRQFGLGGGGTSLTAFNPFEGIAELGYSIRPLAVVSNYHDRLDEPFVGIATYLAPFRRFVVGRLLGGEVTPVADDPTVFGAMIARRVGPIGGSPAAEAYRSHGLLGLVIVLALIGILVATLDSVRVTQYSNATIGMLAFALLLWVRNDFTPVPAECASTIPVLLAIWVLNQRHRSSTEPDAQTKTRGLAR
ncbi:O-antigen polysaccharide polymerase Wzy [Pedococcus sp. 5OH_020]|uniref:O-antigen polysaccharide polymerase Wzy n=1 Tax=Pedococcus sp. 5OH_020 TaxID=2989814 RepID=UPI0022E9B67E|nr:O-antigen polysaccharide polymerase Wzy [Pedococcus sp. 5OH_020]